MTQPSSLTYFRDRWPDDPIPDGEWEWCLYEISYEQDAVLRTVEIYPDGRITRNSIEIEQRHGDDCPSLIDCSLEEGFAGASPEEIGSEAFQEHWNLGTDQPFWFVR
jgi:hypothetical protein